MHDVVHIGVIVKDVEKSKDFYCDILGCEFQSAYGTEKFKIVLVKAGNQVIELLEDKTPSDDKRGAGVIDHIAFNVDDIEKALANLQSAGVTILDMPRAASGNKKVMFFEGPDGERLEFVEG